MKKDKEYIIRERGDFLEIVRKTINKKHYSVNTRKRYIDWIYRFLFFHKNRNIESFSKKEIQEFICFLKEYRNLAASTINQAVSAIKFLYVNVFNVSIDKNFNIYFDPHKDFPIILSREEIKNILGLLEGEKWLMACLMYGCGISISECTGIRIKDIDFNEKAITIGDEANSRKTLLPDSIIKPLVRQTNKVRMLVNKHTNLEKYEGVFLPDSVKVKRKCTSKKIKWHFLFPSPKLRLIKTSGVYVQYPLSESYLQKAIKEALTKSKISKKICCHTFRHSFAVHLLEDGYDIHIIQKLLGHKHIHSTMVYKDVAHTDIKKINSPLNKILGGQQSIA